MMQNVIAFPKAAVTAPAAKTSRGAMTLFLHVKSSTLIVHLAGAGSASISGTRVGKRV